MAGDWIKLALDIDARPQFGRLCMQLSLGHDEAIFHLYKLAGWFQLHGKYGTLQFADISLVDRFLKVDGFASALKQVGWLRVHETTMTLFGFCTTSANRKSLSTKVRADVLSAGACAACGATHNLVIDHKTPIVRGGSCERDNLQALCAPCNQKKGRKTMEEFTNDR